MRPKFDALWGKKGLKPPFLDALYILSVYSTCIFYLCILPVYSTSIFYLYILPVYSTCIFYLFILPVFYLCILPVYSTCIFYLCILPVCCDCSINIELIFIIKEWEERNRTAPPSVLFHLVPEEEPVGDGGIDKFGVLLGQ